jgi:hypothetical protein
LGYFSAYTVRYYKILVNWKNHCIYDLRFTNYNLKRTNQNTRTQEHKNIKYKIQNT